MSSPSSRRCCVFARMRASSRVYFVCGRILKDLEEVERILGRDRADT